MALTKFLFFLVIEFNLFYTPNILNPFIITLGMLSNIALHHKSIGNIHILNFFYAPAVLLKHCVLQTALFPLFIHKLLHQNKSNKKHDMKSKFV